MTNKDAIKILQNDGCCQDCTFGGYPCKLVGCETHQAIDLAIKALEERPQASNNAELFNRTFGIYATEVWSMKEADFLKWLNSEVKNEIR